MRKPQTAAAVLFLALVMAGGLQAAKPQDLCLVPVPPGTDALTAARGRPVYALAEGILLAAGRAEASEAAIHRGPVEELRWVIVRRGADPAPVSGRSIFIDGSRYLLRASDIPAGIGERPELYWVKPLKPFVLKADSVIINPNLAYNPAIASMADQVDSARLRSWVTAMQNFGTRHVNAGNHAAVTAWVKARFDSFGIADVRLDTFNVSGSPIGHNVIATIPGLYDTVTVYLAGGHYDSYATSGAPGADDNASGAAAAMEYARILSLPGNRPNSTVMLVCFDAEELGLYGSEHLAPQLSSHGVDIGCMLNFDMIGAEDNDSAFYSQRYSGNTASAELLIRTGRLYGRHADTNAVGQYGSQYLQQSDSYPFFQEGYPVAWMLERIFSSVYHTANDNTSHMNFRYMTANVKAGFGLFATLAFHPAPVEGVQLQEHGSGTQLALAWRRASAANVTGYRVYWGRASEAYNGQMDVADTTAVIEGLTPDSLYYVAVVAVNGQGQESVFLREYQARPFAGTAQTAFFDDFESGLSQWTRGHSGGSVDWDTTSASYHSAGHSATDSRSGEYANNVNTWLRMAGSLNLTGYSRATLSWWEDYSTESGWDFCYPEISLDGGSTWDTLYIPKYSGSSAGWGQRSADLTPLLASASNFAFRFRLRSDSYITDDGWYVDDVMVTGYTPTGVSQGEMPAPAPGALILRAHPNPAGSKVVFQVGGLAGAASGLDIFDIAGRHVTRLAVDGALGRAEWGLRGKDGRGVASGVYFYRLTAGAKGAVGRLQVLK